MIITRTPYRVSFFGGSTDYHAWYQKHGGAVLSTSINYYCTLICLHKPPFFKNKHRIVWREIEAVNRIDEIKHPVVRSVMQYLDIQRGIEVFYQGDLPAKAGLGSSSAFTVGFLNAMYALRDQMSTKEQLAAEAVYIERDVLKENVGVQDQIATSFGGLNKINIHPDGNFEVHPLTLSPARIKALRNHLMLFYTGISRSASNIAADHIAKIPAKQTELARMRELVDEASVLLTSGRDIEDFGRMLHETWQLKRRISSKVSNDFIDEVYERARRSGAIGGKLLGAGGGGFLLFFVPPESQQQLLRALCDLLWVPFDFERRGSHVAFYSPTSFSRKSLLRRDYAHLDMMQNDNNILNIKDFIKPDVNPGIVRPTKFKLVEEV